MSEAIQLTIQQASWIVLMKFTCVSKYVMNITTWVAHSNFNLAWFSHIHICYAAQSGYVPVISSFQVAEST